MRVRPIELAGLLNFSVGDRLVPDGALRRIGRPHIVILHDDDIDEAGEAIKGRRAIVAQIAIE